MIRVVRLLVNNALLMTLTQHAVQITQITIQRLLPKSVMITLGVSTLVTLPPSATNLSATWSQTTWLLSMTTQTQVVKNSWQITEASRSSWPRVPSPSLHRSQTLAATETATTAAQKTHSQLASSLTWSITPWCATLAQLAQLTAQSNLRSWEVILFATGPDIAKEIPAPLTTTAPVQWLAYLANALDKLKLRVISIKHPNISHY